MTAVLIVFAVVAFFTLVSLVIAWATVDEILLMDGYEEDSVDVSEEDL
jgi:hypothetical protein